MMISTDIERQTKNGIDERNSILQEYEALVEGLQQDLKNCKEEQIRLHTELDSLKNENRISSEVARTAFSHANATDCPRTSEDKECIENLKKQISILQLEKDSMFQLWQMSLKTVDALDNELKTSQNDVVAHRYYEEQVNHVKETYSEAIKVLESKLLQAKENFIKHQTLWESSRDRVDALSREKTELEGRIVQLQTDLCIREESHKKSLETSTANTEAVKRELEASRTAQLKLEAELIETRCLATRMSAKDQESKAKVAEAIELVETAMQEKEAILQREALISEEKSKLEAQMANLAETFAAKLEKELAECKEVFERNTKRYHAEIKELKAELREKVTLLDRAQRETQVLEEEIEKKMLGTEEFLLRSSSRVTEMEHKLKEAEEKLAVCEESQKRKYEERARASEERIAELEGRLAGANDRLRKTQLFGNRELEERVREADERVRETMERYSGVEKRLARALDERENAASELRNLQMSSDREIARRENERRLLEGRIRELQEDLKRANEVGEKAAVRSRQLEVQVEKLQEEMEERRSRLMSKNEDVEAIIRDKSSNWSHLQEKYEERISELTKHVKIHQKLSSRWKDEAQSMANKFQIRYKELRSTAHVLQTENEELKNELLKYSQQLAHCRAQIMQSFEQDDAR